MPDAIRATIAEHIGEIQDPRKDCLVKHEFLDILVLAICGAICGADSWTGIEEYGKEKLDWFETFLELPHGIPSHDTFGDVFGAVDPEELQSSFASWMQAVCEVTQGQVVELDGKQLRRSHDHSEGKKAIYMVNAWASANRLVLGQAKVDEKSNEITAIPKLLRLIAVSGCIVTIDAMGCQREIAQQIVDQEADYVLAVKKNQERLWEDVTGFFDHAEKLGYRRIEHDTCRTVNKGHGRIEIRECWVISDAEYINTIRNKEAWTKLKTIAKVVAERRIGTETKVESRYYISSLGQDAEQMLHAIRGHWGIENSVHWVLDAAFREDDCRIRKKNGAQNFSVLRHIALNLLRQENTAKVGIKIRRLKAGWSNKYLIKVLTGQ